MVYLGFKLRRSLRKLQRAQSQIMTTYYAFLWGVSILSMMRCLSEIMLTIEKHPTIWNLLWLLTRSGLVLLEVSVVVFLLQGYLTSGREALFGTLVVSAAVAAVDLLIKSVLIFGAHVPLFLFGTDAQGEWSVEVDMRWGKWGFWLLHSLCFLIVYCGILVLPYTKWRDCLPAKLSFYRYVAVLAMLNLISCLGALLLTCGVVNGYCVYGVASYVYQSFYPPLLYVTFLSEFFHDDDLDLDLMYYSEMKDAGYFDEYAEDIY
eukprot:CAMPEP_0177602218 /NCGR_PEP_ID=MMETSP0419_2-20121207/14736_1 /TAXON_ID=582737 /ORGANISM="Tetraselmis sp., Strain GSL018" /LENGTH=261 /DNA_ID=CAMNT_0019095657 /DNA_START=473 /DNA_END=1258 /DNA_ORIENTATION=+